MFSNQAGLRQSPLQIFQEPTVVVLSGWGGTGKTQTIARALQGLSENINRVGVIINERSQSSVDVDLSRLPKGFEKLGLHGCACCSQLSDVLDGVKKFADRGRGLTFIEQSPLSRAGDLTSGLKQRGHASVVIFLFNPAQFNDAPAVHVQGIRDADIVVVTHQQRGSAAVDKAKRIVQAVRADLADIPTFIDPNPMMAFPADIWSAALEARSGRRQSLFGGLSGFFSGKGRKSSDFENEREKLVKNYSEISVKPYHRDPQEVLEGVMRLTNAGVVLSRVKGTLRDGVTVDIVKEGGLYRLGVSEGGEGQVLSLRSFEVHVGTKLGELTAHIGTPESSPAFVQQVVSNYPSAETIRRSVQNGVVPLGFESDRYLNELRTILPSLKHVPEKVRRQELGMALVAMIKVGVETRQHVIQAVREFPRDSVEQRYGVMNASYALLSILCEENLQPFFKHPDLVPLRESLGAINFGQALCQTVETLPTLRFEGRKDLTVSEQKRFTDTIHRAVGLGFLSQGAADQMFAALERGADLEYRMNKSVIG